MNIETNKHEYIEQNGCHNCIHKKNTLDPKQKHFQDRINVCNLDSIKIVMWGICRKWEEAELEDDVSDITTEGNEINEHP